MNGDGLDLDERELVVCFVLGVLLGVVLIAITRELVSEWVIASDQADRRRIRELLAEMFAELPDEPDQERPDAAELVRDGLTDGSLTGEASRLKIAANNEPERLTCQ